MCSTAMAYTVCGRRRLKSASNPPGQSNPMSDMVAVPSAITRFDARGPVLDAT